MCPKEVRFIFDAYTRGNFRKLELINHTPEELIYRRRYIQSSPLVLTAAIYDFCVANDAHLFQVEEMANTPGSPCMVFGLDAGTFRQQVEGLHTRGCLRYETTHNLDQIRLKPGFSPISFLSAYYEDLEPREDTQPPPGGIFSMSDPVNMVQLVRDLPSRQRGRACIVLTHEYNGQKEWAAELARQTDSAHLDLLELFSGDAELSRKISQFLIPNLFEFLKGYDKAPVLIASGIEFLKATWSGQANSVEQFASHVETWNQKPCILFVLQYDKIIATREFRRYRQYTFVVDQKGTLAL